MLLQSTAVAERSGSPESGAPFSAAAQEHPSTTGEQLNPGNGFVSRDTAVQSDGKTVQVGSLHGRFAVVRLNANHSLDATFGTGGIVITNFGGECDEADRITILKDGRILVAGVQIQDELDSGGCWCVVRYNGDGTPDVTFGRDGRAIATGARSTIRIMAMAIQSDGKIVLATGNTKKKDGFSQNTGDSIFQTIRLHPNGRLDNGFGDPTIFGRSGSVETDMGGDDDMPAAIAFASDGKILVGGNVARDGCNSFAIARYTSDGRLDKTFGDGGKTINFRGVDHCLKFLAIRVGGSILAAGTANEKTVLVLYRADGSAMQTFGPGGVPFTRHSVKASPESAVDARAWEAAPPAWGPSKLARAC